jgi:hypothetical protein
MHRPSWLPPAEGETAEGGRTEVDKLMSLKLSGIKGLFHGTLQMRRVVELTGLGAAQVLGSVQRGNGGPECLVLPGGAGKRGWGRINWRGY